MDEDDASLAFDWILYSGIFPFIMTPPPPSPLLTSPFSFSFQSRSLGLLLHLSSSVSRKHSECNPPIENKFQLNTWCIISKFVGP